MDGDGRLLLQAFSSGSPVLIPSGNINSVHLTYIKNDDPLTNLTDYVGNSVESFIYRPGAGDNVNPEFQSGELDASKNLVLTFSEVLGDLNYSTRNFELRVLGYNKGITDIDVNVDKLIIKSLDQDNNNNSNIIDISSVYIKYENDDAENIINVVDVVGNELLSFTHLFHNDNIKPVFVSPITIDASNNIILTFDDVIAEQTGVYKVADFELRVYDDSTQNISSRSLTQVTVDNVDPKKINVKYSGTVISDISNIEIKYTKSDTAEHNLVDYGNNAVDTFMFSGDKFSVTDAPEFVTARLNNSNYFEIVLDKYVKDQDYSGTLFDFKSAGIQQTINSVTVSQSGSHGIVTFNTATTISDISSVNFLYTPSNDENKDIRDLQNRSLASFRYRGMIDDTAPIAQSLDVVNGKLEISFDENLASGTIFQNAFFTLKEYGIERTISNIDTSNNKLIITTTPTLTLKAGIFIGYVYTENPNINFQIRDLQGNASNPFTLQGTLNDTTIPDLSGSGVSVDNNDINLIFDEDIADMVYDLSNLMQIKISGVPKTVVSQDVSANKLIIDVGEDVTYVSSIKLVYNKDISGVSNDDKLRDVVGKLVDSFIIDPSDNSIPTVVSNDCDISNGNFRLSFDKNIVDKDSYDISNFSMTLYKIPVTINSLDISLDKVILVTTETVR